MKPAIRLAAVVVLYHPDDNLRENLASYASDVSVVYLIDNSTAPLASIPCQGAEYLWTGENRGISAALNLAAGKAIAAGFDYLLTMDQDSRALPGMVSMLLEWCAPDVGLVAPYLLTRPGDKPPAGSACHQVRTVMTSGSILNLKVYQKVGPFRDDFFIDFVDIEYSLRLQKGGYKVLQAESACLEHHVGRRIGLGCLSVTTHTPLRKYYKSRNRFQVGREYAADFPLFVWWDRFRFLLESVRLLLFEPQKTDKLRMMLRGYRDYRHGVFGKYRE